MGLHSITKMNPVLKIEILEVTHAANMGLTVSTIGGLNDGEEFSAINAKMSDGTTKYLWTSSAKKGYFKQVFVPWDFEHEQICKD